MVTTTQQERVLIQLREKILRGAFKGGARLPEVRLAKLFGVSRTPVKLALMRLEEEGLVEEYPTGGYVASELTTQVLKDGILLRGALEALAVRLLAERGLRKEVKDVLSSLLNKGDSILASYPDNSQEVAYDDYLSYQAMNDQFHTVLLEATENSALLRAWELNNRRPAASPSATLPLHDSNQEAAFFLRQTHKQHHLLVQAIEHRQSMRAHGLATEHAEAAAISLDRYFAIDESASESWSAISQAKNDSDLAADLNSGNAVEKIQAIHYKLPKSSPLAVRRAIENNNETMNLVSSEGED